MNNKLFLSPAAALGLCLLSITAAAQTVSTTPTPSPEITRLQTELEPKIKEEIQKGNIPGFAIGVIKDGKLIYAKGFGVAKIGGDTPVTSKSLFHMASVTKTFVATAVMQLVETGKIDLDAPLIRYLPYFKMNDERYRVITIRQMLSHISGIPDTVDYHWDKPEYDAGALERFVRSVANQKLIFAPGEKFAYSNTAYEILGDVIAKVSGESFEAYVQHNILTPLGMKDSTLLVREANPQLLTSPHVLENEKVVVSKVFPYNRAHSPSSTLYSSIEDMSAWAIANLNHGELNGKRILKQETAELMWRPVVPALGKIEGISWFTTESGGHRFVLHSGGDVGFESLLVLAPDDGVAVVAMCNFAAPEKHYLNDFVNAAIRIMLGTKGGGAAATTNPSTAPAAPPINADEARKKADEILAAYVTALGGQAALEKITSRVAKGTFEVSGIAMSGPVEMYAKAPNKLLTVLQMLGQASFKEAFDGSVGWGQDPEEGITDKTGLELGTLTRDADFYQPLKLREQYPNLIFKGPGKVSLGKGGGGKVEERDAQVLEAPRNGRPRLFYFDTSTGLLLRTEERDGSGKVTGAVEYGDYREVDGVKVPFGIYQVQDAHFTFKFTEVKQNVPIDDAVFVKPKK
jgi:CubicO group peptidase (beta-lactamase class C family)